MTYLLSAISKEILIFYEVEVDLFFPYLVNDYMPTRGGFALSEVEAGQFVVKGVGLQMCCDDTPKLGSDNGVERLIGRLQ